MIVEEEEDEEDILHRLKPKLPASVPHVMMSQAEYQNYSGEEEPRKNRKKPSIPRKPKQKESEIPSTAPKVEKVRQDEGEIPVKTGNRYKEPMVPQITYDANPMLHSRHLFNDIDRVRGEVLLAQLEAALATENYETPPVDEQQEAMFEELRQGWLHKAADILTGVPEQLPPFREINHKIPLMDENKKYNYHLPRCPDAFKTQLLEKIQKYKTAGWWEETNVSQAAPMLCVAKKDGFKLRTPIDCRKRNDNTEKDVTPFPDQEQIRMDVARGKIRSKIDMSNAYEQIRVEPSDVWKTAFATVYGTFVSHTMQIGDCNAPATFQRLMTAIFRDYIGKFVHVYLDDIFVYSDSIEQHEIHLGLVFDKLRQAQLWLEASKCQLYATKMDCLGHVIDDQGIHADPDKMTRIREWRTPRNKHDLMRFLGLVQYLAHFMPDVSSWTGPLSAIQSHGNAFIWKPIHQVCMDNIKALACKTPILKPIDPRNKDPIWVICDASASGVGAVYGQGPDWKTCRPAGFMSKKFTSAQHNYRVFEMETIAILEALLKWEDKLIGNRINVVTDHRALEFFKTQRRLSSRQMRWMEYLSRFDFSIQYVKGVSNKVADSFSRYHQSDTDADKWQAYDYVNADLRLDPEGDDLPWGRVVEIRSMAVDEENRQLRESTEEREIEARKLSDASKKQQSLEIESQEDDDPTIFDELSKGPELTTHLEKVYCTRKIK